MEKWKIFDFNNISDQIPVFAGMTVLLLFLFLGIQVKQVNAHLAGQPPFFKINGVFTELYDVPTISLADFILPQDKPPALYVINESINFELDTNALPIPPEIVKISTFEWDWGDGSSKSTGMLNMHSYTKPGSYIIEITAKTADVAQPQLIQSTIIHILPTKDYQMPKAKILVNGKGVEDPLLDDVKIEFGKEFTLDAGETAKGSGKIVEYFWDLGDAKSKTGEKVTYQYGKEQYAFFPVLRVKDENNLISDAFIQITNSENDLSTEPPTLDNMIKRNKTAYVIGGIIVLSLITAPFLIRKLKKKNS